MKDIKLLCTSFDKIGIEYTIRQSGEYEYVFIGECKNIHHLNWTLKTMKTYSEKLDIRDKIQKG